MEYEYKLQFENLPNGDLRPRLEKKSSDHNELMRILFQYWKCGFEGKKVLDGYHESLIYNKDKDIYNFNIQTSDSPEGDTWWRGTFTVAYGKIKIIEDRSYAT